jgi:hypothetical protein
MIVLVVWLWIYPGNNFFVGIKSFDGNSTPIKCKFVTWCVQICRSFFFLPRPPSTQVEDFKQNRIRICVFWFSTVCGSSCSFYFQEEEIYVTVTRNVKIESAKNINKLPTNKWNFKWFARVCGQSNIIFFLNKTKTFFFTSLRRRRNKSPPGKIRQQRTSSRRRRQ